MDVKIPSWWKQNAAEGVKRTRSHMMVRRKNANLPHQSFDLTGDGGVNQKEFFIATHFDRDRDGKLNDKEKEECMKAFKTGELEKVYKFGCEARFREKD